jgi:hypothetical protein
MFMLCFHLESVSNMNMNQDDKGLIPAKNRGVSLHHCIQNGSRAHQAF